MRCEGVHANREWEDQPAARGARLVEEDKDESCPEASEKGEETDDETGHGGGWDEVAQGLHAEEAREGITLHGLEDVVLGGVEDFRVVAPKLLDRDGDVVCDAVREDDLTLGAGEEVGVEDLLGRLANVGASNCVCRGVGVGVWVVGAAHEAWTGALVGRCVAACTD